MGDQMIGATIRGKDPDKIEFGSTLETAESGSLVESIYQRLLQGILNGHYPDQAVLSELALARELGVSRTPVHDALRQLAKDGLVTREQNCRARVAGISPDDVFEVFEMRKFLEGPAAELAAGRMDRRHLAPLRAAADALLANPTAKDWTLRWADFDELFHQTIAEASGNRRLAQDISRYRLLHKGFNQVATDPDCLQSAMAEHLAILEALEMKNGPLSRERMVAHIAVWQDFFIRNVPKAKSAPHNVESGRKLTRRRNANAI
jgi:DNA-binding GntR family transcriptional regulator